MKKTVFTLVLLLIFPCLHVKAQNGKLEKIEQSVYKKKTKEHKKEIPRKKKHTNSCCDSAFEDASSSLFLFVLTSPFSVPCALLDNDYALNNSYRSFPFEFEDYYTDETSKYYSGKFKYGYLEANDNITVKSFSGLFQYKRIGINIEQSRYKEVLSNGQKDHLKITSATVFFNFARNDKMNFRTGIGIKELERTKNKPGFNFLYDMDWFIKNPFHLSNRFEYSRVGSTDILRFAPSIGIMYNRFEVSGGYKYERFDKEKVKGFELETTIWF